MLLRVTNELCLLLASGESPCLTDSGHISAAVEEDMTVVILLSVRREGLDAHTKTQKHTYSLDNNNLEMNSVGQSISCFFN